MVYLRFVELVSQSDVDKIGGVCSELGGMQAIPRNIRAFSGRIGGDSRTYPRPQSR